MVGVSNGVVDFVVYFVITRFLFTFPEFILPAKAISYLVATLWSYFANRTFTFKDSTPVTLGGIGKFYSTVGLGIVLNVGVQHVVVSMLLWHDLIGVVIAAGATAVWGFLFSKFYVFKKQ